MGGDERLFLRSVKIPNQDFPVAEPANGMIRRGQFGRYAPLHFRRRKSHGVKIPWQMIASLRDADGLTGDKAHVEAIFCMIKSPV